MGRPRKFVEGQKVIYLVEMQANLAVVVDYKQDDSGHSMYRIQRIADSKPWGPPVWKETWELTLLDRTTNLRQVGIYRKNKAIPDRGCICGCCVHVSKELSEVRIDGTFFGD